MCNESVIVVVNFIMFATTHAVVFFVFAANNLSAINLPLVWFGMPGNCSEYKPMDLHLRGIKHGVINSVRMLVGLYAGGVGVGGGGGLLSGFSRLLEVTKDGRQTYCTVNCILLFLE